MATTKASTYDFLIAIGFVAIILCSCSSLCNATYEFDQNNNNSKSMFVFGDSIYDIGNLQFYHPQEFNPSNHHPYGITYFPAATGRFSDGLLIPDIIGRYAAVSIPLPYLHPNVSFVHGANFAYAGATILDEDNVGAMNLPQQLNAFFCVVANWSSELGDYEAQKRLNEAIFLIEFGGVDYGLFPTNHPNANEAEQHEFVKLMIEILVTTIKEMYFVGARKFAFQNVAVVGCIPLLRVKNGTIIIGDCAQSQSSKMAKMHNIALPKAIKLLEDELKGFKYGIFDFYTAQLDMIQNPQKYGFFEGEIACCGYGMLNSGSCGEEGEPYMVCTYPSAYLFFDRAHNTQKANFILSYIFWEGSSKLNNATMRPYNLKQLFGLDNQSQETNCSRLMIW